MYPLFLAVLLGLVPGGAPTRSASPGEKFGGYWYQGKAELNRYELDQARYGDRARLAKEVEDMRATLAAAQVGSRLNLLAATDTKTELLRNAEYAHNSLIENQHQLESTTSNREAFVQQWLAQAFLAAVFDPAGWAGLALLRAALVALAFALLLAAVRICAPALAAFLITATARRLSVTNSSG